MKTLCKVSGAARCSSTQLHDPVLAVLSEMGWVLKSGMNQGRQNGAS